MFLWIRECIWFVSTFSIISIITFANNYCHGFYKPLLYRSHLIGNGTNVHFVKNIENIMNRIVLLHYSQNIIIANLTTIRKILWHTGYWNLTIFFDITALLPINVHGTFFICIFLWIRGFFIYQSFGHLKFSSTYARDRRIVFRWNTVS